MGAKTIIGEERIKMFIKKEDYNSKEYDDAYLDETSSIWDEAKDEYISDEQFEFADGIWDLFQEIIDNESASLKEEFTSMSNARIHYREHCLNSNPRRISSRNNVYYDFNNIQDYLNYEENISKYAIITKNEKTDMFIEDLNATDKILNAFRKLFRGGSYLVLGLACGFRNNEGPVRVCLHSFAQTFNYQENTIDFLIQSPNDKTITLYPIDANYLQTKLNNLANRCLGTNITYFNYNH